MSDLAELVRSAEVARRFLLVPSLFVQHRCRRSERGKCRPEHPRCGVWRAIDEKNVVLHDLSTALAAVKGLEKVEE